MDSAPRMKHLVSLGNLEPRQHEEVVALLNKHRVRFRETPPSIFGSGTIQVAEGDLSAAQALLREESAEFATEARQAWEREWRSEHGGSFARWFLHRWQENPAGTLVRLVLLVLMVSVFVVYPVWYVLKSL